MKRISLIFISWFIILTAFAQSKKEKEEVQNVFWGINDLAPKDLSIPEKWEGESAVILFKNVKYDYNKSGNKVTYTSSIRKQILLKDEASIDRYSEFSKKDNFFTKEYRVWEIDGGEFIGIRIKKPGGEFEKIEIKEVSVEKNGESYISVPNLEVGDVIDFYIQVKQVFTIATTYAFKQVENLISETYPIKVFKMNFNVDNDFYINYKSLNGAPDLVPIKVDTKKNKTYEINASDIEKYKIENWSYLFNEVPCYKMQVYYAKTRGMRDNLPYYTAKGESIILNKATEIEIVEVANNTSKPLGALQYLYINFDKLFEENKIEGLENQLEYVYYYIRYKCTLIDMDYNLYDYNDILQNLKYKYKSMNPYHIIYDRNKFLSYFMTYLNTSKIDYSLIIGKKRYNGSIDDLLLTGNEESAIRIKLPNKELYIQWHELNGNFNTISPFLLSSEAYALTSIKPNARLFRFDKIEKINLPESKSEDHIVQKNVSVNLMDFETLNISSDCEKIGDYKAIGHSQLLSMHDIIDEENKHFGRAPFIDVIKASKKQLAAIKDRLKAFKETQEKDLNENIKKKIEGEFDVVLEDDFDFEVVETGRFNKHTPFNYKVNFKIKDQLIKKAGSNYILEVGKLIGPQKSIKEDELDRLTSIDMRTARQLKNTITVNIPDGFEVKGVDKLNKSIENETASFTSSAKIEGDNLIINTEKIYKSHHLPKEKWLKLVEVLDVAFKFNEESILFKKMK